jgi:hypothetical protein
MSSAPVTSMNPVVINLGAVKAELDATLDLHRTEQQRADAWLTAATDRHNDPNDHDMCNLAATRHIVNATVTDATDRDRDEFWGAA